MTHIQETKRLQSREKKIRKLIGIMVIRQRGAERSREKQRERLRHFENGWTSDRWTFEILELLYLRFERSSEKFERSRDRQIDWILSGFCDRRTDRQTFAIVESL